MSPITEDRPMQFEIPEGVRVHIIVGSLEPTERGCTLPAVIHAAPVEAKTVRSGGLLLKGGLVVMLLAASFGAGDYFATRPRTPELTRDTATLPRPAPAGEQHAFPDRPLPREVTGAAPSGQVPAEFQKQLQQPPTVIPPPGQSTAPTSPGSGSSVPSGAGALGKNPFGLEN
jgi:hypothetical protein